MKLLKPDPELIQNKYYNNRTSTQCEIAQLFILT